jgi:hypothetical protein
MKSIFNYFEAKNRLREAKKTILMMGGEDECQPMLLGQRDFLELEVDYYHDEMVSLGYKTLTIVCLCVILYLANHFLGLYENLLHF